MKARRVARRIRGRPSARRGLPFHADAKHGTELLSGQNEPQPPAARQGGGRRRHRLESDEVLARRRIDLGVRVPGDELDGDPQTARRDGKGGAFRLERKAVVERAVGERGIERREPRLLAGRDPRGRGRAAAWSAAPRATARAGARGSPRRDGIRRPPARDPLRRRGRFRSSIRPARAWPASSGGGGTERRTRRSRGPSRGVRSTGSTPASVTVHARRDHGTPWIGSPAESKWRSGEDGSSSTSRPAAR